MAFRDLVVRRNRSNVPVCNSFFTANDFFSRELDQVFGSVFNHFPVATRSEKSVSTLSPKINVSGDDQSFELTAEMPGIDEKDIQLTLKDRVLTIKGEKKQEKETKEQTYYRRERHLGSFQRSFRMPDDVDLDKVSAAYENGILKVSLPKTEKIEAKAKRIEVKAT